MKSSQASSGLPEDKFEHNMNPSQIRNEPPYRTTQVSSYAEQKRLGWCKDSQKNKPQSNSLTSASLIFTSAGMSLSSSVGFSSFPHSSHIQICWFIATIIGACISGALAHHISKRIFNIVASVLVIINGFLFIAANESTTAIVLARYCDGIAFGLTLIPTILAGSEQSVKRFRGMVLSVEQVGLAIGALLNISSMKFSSIGLIHGYFALACGIIALVFTFILTLESPVFLLRKEAEDKAVNVLSRLQEPTTITNETYLLLNECKALLDEDRRRGISINLANSWIPMAKMILFRCFVSMTLLYLLNLVLLRAMSIDVLSFSLLSYYLIVVYVIMRLFGVLFSTYILDTIGRRIPSAIACIVGGGILIVIACLDLNGLRNNAGVAIYLVLIYQLVSGIMAPASTCYLAEAFSISVKPYFILATVISENILQIIACCVISNFSDSTFLYTLGSLQIIYGIVFIFIMPETKQTTLRKALKMFQSINGEGMHEEQEGVQS